MQKFKRLFHYRQHFYGIWTLFIPVWHLPENIEKLSAVSRPLASNSLHGGEEQLELSDGDAVAGQHPQQLHQEVGHDLRSRGQTVQQMLNQRYLGASLQISGGFSQYCDEHGPYFSLKISIESRPTKLQSFPLRHEVFS